MILVFAGPSLPPSAVPAVPDLRVLPPAAQGDVYQAARTRPWGIGIVDGFFEHVPAVWHKEILWAMSEGIHVFGSSSMGALRAAELADFGMVGTGPIFEQFRDGSLVGDDEVALAHLPVEYGYSAVSEALVNIRATLAAAVEAGVCDSVLADTLITLARSRYYPDRTWPALLSAAHATSSTRDPLAAIKAWLPAGRVDQKRRDALALIEAMRIAREADPGPLRVDFTFQHTAMWDQAVRRCEDGIREKAHPHSSELLDELRLLGDEQLYTLAVQGSLLRSLAHETSERRGLVVGRDLVEQAAVEFRRTRTLHTGEVMCSWLDTQGLDPESFIRMMTREARLRWIEELYERDAKHHLIDQLRAMGCYGSLHAHARAKRAALEREGLDASDLADSGTGEAALWHWYFEEQLGQPVPGDLAAYSERLGFSDPGALRRCVSLERWYRSRS